MAVSMSLKEAFVSHLRVAHLHHPCGCRGLDRFGPSQRAGRAGRFDSSGARRQADLPGQGRSERRLNGKRNGKMVVGWRAEERFQEPTQWV